MRQYSIIEQHANSLVIEYQKKLDPFTQATRQFMVDMAELVDKEIETAGEDAPGFAAIAGAIKMLYESLKTVGEGLSIAVSEEDNVQQNNWVEQ